jgi:hypothetical protein
MGESLIPFVAGLLTAGYAVAALFFARFWRDTKDRLFAWFAVAFLILAIQRAALAVGPRSASGDALLYGLRLAAFLIILIAVVDKNRDATARD